MKIRITIASAAFVGIACLSNVGCQESRTYRSEKPVVEDEIDTTSNEMRTDVETATEDREPATNVEQEAFEQETQNPSDSADADKPVVEVETPASDVEVNGDRSADDTSVEVDTNGAKVDVDADQ